MNENERHLQAVSYELQGETHTRYVIGAGSVSELANTFDEQCPLKNSVYSTDEQFWKAIEWCEGLGIDTDGLFYVNDSGERRRYSSTWSSDKKGRMFIRWLKHLYGYEDSDIYDSTSME